MPVRKPPPPDERPQRERFIQAAREIGASEDPEEFERVFRRVVAPLSIKSGTLGPPGWKVRKSVPSA